MEDELVLEMAAYAATYLSVFAEKFGGETTMNELRVMNCVFRSHYAGMDVGVALISRELGIPKSTVSRAALNLRADGWIREETSTVDGRKRYFRLTTKTLERFEQELERLLERWPRAA